MDDLRRGSHLDNRIGYLLPESSGQYNKRRAYPLPAGLKEVIGPAVKQRKTRGELGPDLRLHSLQMLFDRLEYLTESLSQLSLHSRPC